MRPEVIGYLKSIGISDQGILYLVACRMNLECQIDDEQFMLLIKEGIIERDYNKNTVNVIIPIFISDKEELNLEGIARMVNISEEIERRVDEYRMLFKGIRAGSIGTKKDIKLLLLSWFTANDNYTFNDVLTATRHYIDTEDPKYISNADNFISTIKNGKVVSKLLIVLEDLQLGVIKKEFN
jgi:hypothetical protein